jgi:hypothetical protein
MTEETNQEHADIVRMVPKEENDTAADFTKAKDDDDDDDDHDMKKNDPLEQHPPAEQDLFTPPLTVQYGLVFFSALYTTFFAGAFFGWGPMQIMLEEDGAFSYKCNTDNQQQDHQQLDPNRIQLETAPSSSGQPCEAQTLSLLNVQFVAILMPFLSPVLGWITDTYGVFCLMQVLSLTSCGGLALILVASKTDVEQLLYPAFCLIGITFVSTNIIIVQTGLIFSQGSTQRRVISFLNVLLDAGSITPLLLYWIYNALDTTLVVIISGYLGFALFCFGGALYFWRTIIQCTTAAIASSEKELGETDVLTMKVDDSVVGVAIPNTQPDPTETAQQHSDKPSSPPPNSTPPVVVLELEETVGYVQVALRKPADQLKSQLYILLVSFFMFHVARNNWVLTTSREWLASLGDDDKGNQYLTLFTALSVASIVGLPFLDFLLDKYGYHLGFQAVNLLGMLHGIIQVSSDNLNVQVIGFVLFSFYRCFTFATAFSFLSVFLGGETIGRGAGFMAFFGSLSSLLNLAWAAWVVKGLKEDYFLINLLYTVGVVPVMIFTLWIGTCMDRETLGKALLADKSALDRSSHVSIQLSRHVALLVGGDYDYENGTLGGEEGENTSSRAWAGVDSDTPRTSTLDSSGHHPRRSVLVRSGSSKRLSLTAGSQDSGHFGLRKNLTVVRT